MCPSYVLLVYVIGERGGGVSLDYSCNKTELLLL